MGPVGYQSGTFWVPTESVTAFTLSQSSLGYSSVWTIIIRIFDKASRTHLRTNRLTRSTVV